MRQAIRVLKTPVTLILLLAILGFGASWGIQHATMDDKSARAAANCVLTDVGGTLTPDKVTVRVFNGGTNNGLAKRTALYQRAWGFPAPYFNSSDRKVTKTTVIGHAEDDPEVRLVQQFFKDSVTEGDGREDHIVDVILGDKDTQIKEPKEPVATLAVDGPVCLPTITAPTTSPSASPTKKK